MCKCINVVLLQVFALGCVKFPPPLFPCFGFFCYLCVCQRAHVSSLEKLNMQRKSSKEPPVDVNHPFIYSLKNKSSWKIEGKTFAVICHFSALILHMRNVLLDLLACWIVENKEGGSTLPEATHLSAFMFEWASTLTAIYTVPELKTEYAQCCACMEESQGKSVVFANLPTRIGEYLKDQYTCFYIAFCVFDDEEEEEQHSITSQDGNDNNSDTESEGGQAGETEQIEETQVEQEEPNSLVMQFCREVDDEPETDTDTPQESDTVGEGSPRRFKSTSMDVNAPPLGTVPEEQEAIINGEMADFLWILEDKDMECLFGATPENLKQSLRKGQVKGTVQEVTLALLDCKHASTWEQRHLPIESTVPLPEHPQQQDLFNSFVEVVALKKPLTEHKGVCKPAVLFFNAMYVDCMK